MARDRLKARDDRGTPSPAAKAAMLLASVFVAALFGYMLWQAATAGGESVPEARIVGTRALPDGDVLVEVALRNEGIAGLREAVVEVDCDDPPPELTLANVPAEGERRAFVRCPAGTTDPQAKVSSFARA